MRKFLAIVTFVTFALLEAVGQQVPANPIATQQITLPVFTLNPAPAQGASIQLSGNPGPQTIFYWVVAEYPVGNATLTGPLAITNAPNTLSASNFVQIAPILPAGATAYDLLKTLTTIPPGGACACAVATGVAVGTVTNDQSNATGAYTVSTVNVNSLRLTLQNEVQSSGVSHLILRQNQNFVADLSLGSAPTPPLIVANVSCGTLNGQVQTDAGCVAAFNQFVLQSKGSTANNFRHMMNLYFETDLHQTGGGNQFYSLASGTSVVLDAGSTGAATQQAFGIQPYVTVGDPTNSGITLGQAIAIRARILVSANAHVAIAQGLLVYAPNVAAGGLISNLYGVNLDAPSGVQPTNSVGFLGGSPYQYGAGLGGSIAALIADDSSGPQSSGICHSAGIVPPPTLHDCWYSGNGSPNGLVTANIGAIYSQRNGGIGTSLWQKGSGVGNTGWLPTPVTIGTATAALGTAAINSNTCAAVITVAATGVLTTDIVSWSFNADPNGVTGYGAGATGSLQIWAFPTADNVNFRVCNLTAGAITPGAATLNWTVKR